MLHTGPHDGGHLRGVGRPHDGERAAAVAPAPVEIPGRQIALSQYLIGADGGTQIGDQ